MDSYLFQEIHHVAQQPCHRPSCDFAIVRCPPSNVYHWSIRMWHKLGYIHTTNTLKFERSRYQHTDSILLLYNLINSSSYT